MALVCCRGICVREANGRFRTTWNNSRKYFTVFWTCVYMYLLLFKTRWILGHVLLHSAFLLEIAILKFVIANVGWQSILGAFAKLRKATISFIMSICPSIWNNSAPTWRISKRFYIEHVSKSLEKIKIPLKSDKNNRVLDLQTCVLVSSYLAQFRL